MADDIGYECFSSYGSREYATPVLDRLAAEGIRFGSNRHALSELDGFGSLLGLICQEAGSEQSIPQIQEQYSRIIASKLLCSLASNIRRDPFGDSCPSFGRKPTARLRVRNIAQRICASRSLSVKYQCPEAGRAKFDISPSM